MGIDNHNNSNINNHNSRPGQQGHNVRPQRNQQIPNYQSQYYQNGNQQNQNQYQNRNPYNYGQRQGHTNQSCNRNNTDQQNQYYNYNYNYNYNQQQQQTFTNLQKDQAEQIIENQNEGYYEPDEEDDDEKEPKFWKRFLKISIVGICIGVLVYCGVMIYDMVNKTRIPNNVLSEVLEETDGKTFLKLNWDALQEAYPEIIGWIYVPHTDINYPIVQNKSDSYYYLKHGAMMEPNNLGAIFLDKDGTPDFSDDNTLIYGHSVMYTGGMFTGISRFQQDSHWNENKYLYILTPTNTYRGDIRLFAKTRDGTQYYLNDFGGWLPNILQWQENNAMHSRADEIPVGEGSHLVTLSTCDLAEGGLYTKTRFIVQAKLDYYMDDVEYVEDDKDELVKKLGTFFDDSFNQLDKGKKDTSDEETTD